MGRQAITTDHQTLFNRWTVDIEGAKAKWMGDYPLHGAFVFTTKKAVPDIIINFGVRYLRRWRNRIKISIGSASYAGGVGRAAFLYALLRLSTFHYKHEVYNGSQIDIEVSFVCNYKRYWVHGDAVQIMRYFTTKCWASRDQERAMAFDRTRGREAQLMEYLRPYVVVRESNKTFKEKM